MSAAVPQQMIDRLLCLEAGDDVWQLRAARLSDWLDLNDEARIVDAYVAVSVEQRRVGVGEGVEWGAPRVEPAFTALLTLARDTRPSRRPARVEVDDPELFAGLAPVLETCGVGCVLVEHTEQLDEPIHELRRELLGVSPRPPLFTHVSSERLRSLSAAFSRFAETRPWLRLASVDFIQVEAPTGDDLPAWCSVQGGVGTHKGLIFHSGEDEIYAAYDGSLTEDEIAEQECWVVGLETPDELAIEDRRRWKREGLPLVQGVEVAIPSHYQGEKGFGVVTLEQFDFFEAVVRALAESTDEDLDEARWERTVTTSAGDVRVRLALPQLLPPNDGIPARDESLDDREDWQQERTLRDMARVMEGQHFDGPAQAQAFLRSRLRAGALPHPDPTTPRERAEDLIHEANLRDGRRRVQLARRALREWADCADAYVIQAEEMPDRDLALAFWGEAYAAAVRAAGGEDAIRESAGHIWNQLDLRPYLRARSGYGEMLLISGRVDEGARHLFELLSLDPSDPMGVGYPLLRELLAERRHDAAEELVKIRFTTPPFGPWATLLIAFARHGDAPATHEAFALAQRANPHVAKYLSGSAPLPDSEPEESRPGSDEEARIVAMDLMPGWEAQPGAIEWLQGVRKQARREGKAKRRKR